MHLHVQLAEASTPLTGSSWHDLSLIWADQVYEDALRHTQTAHSVAHGIPDLRRGPNMQGASLKCS